MTSSKGGAVACIGHAAVSSSFSKRTKLKTSRKVLYSGAGAMRMTEGFRMSQTTPCLDKAWCTFCMSALKTNDSWHPRCSGSLGVMTSTWPPPISEWTSLSK
uniref:Uncharacterized protein n=1 Tax=Alexandrium catenella TaxID=2925 RepID=A0A7S1SHZ9_ALECA